MIQDQNAILRSLLTHRNNTFAYIMSIVHDEHLAEDVFQDVSVLALEKKDEIRDAEALPVWLRRAARFKALAALDKRGRSPQSLDKSILDLLDADWRQIDQVESSDFSDALKHCLGALTNNNRRLVEMRYGQNIKAGRIAEMLGRRPHSVYVALSRIHKQLAECIQRRVGMENHADA